MSQLEYSNSFEEIYGRIQHRTWDADPQLEREKLDLFKEFCKAEGGHILRQDQDLYHCLIGKSANNVVLAPVPAPVQIVHSTDSTDQGQCVMAILVLLVIILSILGFILGLKINEYHQRKKVRTKEYRHDAESQLNRNG